MFDFPALTSPQNARIRGVVQLRQQRHRRACGLLIAEGSRDVARALDADLALCEVFVCPTLVRPCDAAGAASCRDRSIGSGGAAAWFSVSETLMEKMSYRRRPQCMLAVFEQPRWSLDDLGRSSGRDADGCGELWLVAVGTAKPGNLGAMARSAEAAGARGVLVADAVVDPFNPNVICASTGAVFRIPVVAGASSDLRSFLRARGVQIVSAMPAADVTYLQVDMTLPTALVMGTEDRGLHGPWVADPDVQSVRIPMPGRVVDSLNTSAAAAVLLFEAVRQRGNQRNPPADQTRGI